MSYKTILLDVDQRGVARLWLNRPDKHHALNADMIAELHQAVSRLGTDEAGRVAVPVLAVSGWFGLGLRRGGAARAKASRGG